MKIVIANDHGAVLLKNKIVDYLTSNGHCVTNLGVDTEESVDYPDIAKECCTKFLDGGYDFGILACGTGVGISIAANKIDGIRAALVNSSYAAKMAKCHNNANFIVFGGRVTYSEDICSILQSYIDATFEGERHQRRIDKITALEAN